MTDWRRHPKWPGFVQGAGLLLYKGQPLTLGAGLNQSETQRTLERMAPNLSVGPLPTTGEP